MKSYQAIWPLTFEEERKLLNKRMDNLKYSIVNDNENRVFDRLEKEVYHKFQRQYIFGQTIFDFFSPAMGIAVEVDGKTHNQEWDAAKDKAHLEYYGVVTLRVRNQEKEDLDLLIKTLRGAGWWHARNYKKGIKLDAQTLDKMKQINKKANKEASRFLKRFKRVAVKLELPSFEGKYTKGSFQL